MADEAILEATEPVESSVEEPIEGAEGESTESEIQETAPQEPQGAAQTWKSVKEALKDKPELHRQVKKALHFMEDATKRFPDGIGKAQERLQMLSQLDDNPDDPEYVPGSATIEEVISNTLAERSFWRDFDQAFQAGDPKIINAMIEANPESFQRLIPEAMDRFSEVNPEAFSTYICRSVSGYLDQAQIPLQLALLDRILPQDSNDPGLKTVIEAVNTFRTVFNEIKAGAARQFNFKALQNEQQMNQSLQNQPSLEDRETVILDREWNQEIAPRSNDFAASEAMKFAGKTRFTPLELSNIKKFIKTEVNARVLANRGYQQKIKGFLKAKNKAAYTMAVESEHKKIIGGPNGAAARAVADILAKRKAQPAKRQVPSTAPSNQVQQKGNFEWIAKSPGALKLQVDWRRTTSKMYNQERRAFIQGRTKEVRWK